MCPGFGWKKRGEAAPTRQPRPKRPPSRSRLGGIPPRRLSDSRPAGAAEVAAAAAARRRSPSPQPRRRQRSPTRPRPSLTARRRRSAQRRRPPARKPPAAPPKIALPDVKKEILVSIDVGEQTVAVLEDGKPAEVYLGRPERKLGRRQRLQGGRRQRPPGHGGVVRRHRPPAQRLPLRRRDRRPRAGGQAPRKAHPGADLPRRGGARPGRQGPDGHEGRAAHDRDLAARPLPRLHAVRRRNRRLAQARGRRARAPEEDLQGPRAAGGRAHRPHRRRGRLRGGALGRPQAPAQALVDDPRPRRPNRGAGARLPGGRAAAPHRPRPLHHGTSSASWSTTSAPTAGSSAT